MTAHERGLPRATSAKSRWSQKDLIEAFVGSKGDYYKQQSTKIGSKSGFTAIFNLAAAVLGPVWFGMRGLWNWALPFAILEALQYASVGQGILAGFAILFCAMILDRVVQGRRA